MKISEAIYRRGNVEQKIHVSSLDRASYNSKYRGYLYCPEGGCNAWLCYVERKKNESSFFRTWSKKEHKEGCPYEVKYDKTDESPYRKAGEHYINLSNKHIDEKLRRTYEQMIMNNPNPAKKAIKLTKRKIKGRVEEVKEEPALFNEGVDDNGGREPYILTRRFDKLDDLDVEKIRCVFGEVRSISIFDNHAYINLTNKTDKSIKIYFSEYFKANNKS